MQERPSANDLGLVGELPAASRCDLPMLGDVDEIPVGEALPDQRPQALGGLDLWRVGGLEDQVDARWNHYVSGGVPTCAVDHEDDPTVRARADLLGEVREDRRGAGARDRAGDHPLRSGRVEDPSA